MALRIKGTKNIFPHARETKTGGGNERVGQSTIIVSLDGTGDTDDIQSGVDLLPKDGGIVFIKEGTYYIDAAISLTKDDATIQGTGHGTIIRAIGGKTSSMFSITGNNCTVKDLTIWGNSSGGGTQYGIHATTATRILIHNCTIFSCGHWGINISSTNDASIVNSSIYSCSGGGILFAGARGIIIGDIIYNNDDDGISLITADDCIITGNIIYGNDKDNTSTYSGVKLTTSDNNIISSNQCFDNDNYGIDISNAGSDKNILIGNICLTNGTGQINDTGTNTHPNGASGTTNLALDDLNIIA